MSKALADEAMAALGMQDRAIVYATIEAETGWNNVPGDGGYALGYGQVWLRWHFDKLRRVAAILGVGLPGEPDFVPGDGYQFSDALYGAYRGLLLGNDRLSMYLTVAVIQAYWAGAGGDWGAFTRGYVGPAIPDADFNRRLRIYERVKAELGGSSTNQGPVSPASPGGGGGSVPAPRWDGSNAVIPVPDGVGAVAAVMALLAGALLLAGGLLVSD